MLYTTLISGEGDDNLGRNWPRLAFTSIRVISSEWSFSLHELMRDILGPAMHGTAMYPAYSSVGETRTGFGALSHGTNLGVLCTQETHMWMYIGDYRVLL